MALHTLSTASRFLMDTAFESLFESVHDKEHIGGRHADDYVDTDESLLEEIDDVADDSLCDVNLQREYGFNLSNY